MNIQTQLRKLNTFGFFACLRIPDTVWVVFLIGRGFSLWQIGLAEALFHVVSLLCEIPSGMAADLMGRRRSLAAAGVCGLVSALLMACSTSFFGVCLSMVFPPLPATSSRAVTKPCCMTACCKSKKKATMCRFAQNIHKFKHWGIFSATLPRFWQGF